MNPPNTHHASPVHAGDFVDLAASGIGTKVIAFVVGLIVVIILLGGFWYGARLRSRMGPPPKPSEQPVKPDHQAHIEENTDPSDRFPGHGERLYPHQLGGHGEEAYRPPGEDEPESGDGSRRSGGEEPPRR
ncbi:DUF6479 family protein [Streptomyces sp. NPDC087420]|uniref:DUF6479 family protein n=1 Tax=Streptomyces sp. NPDC087420 TaxID=3365785 RepID=UPI0038358AD3